MIFKVAQDIVEKWYQDLYNNISKAVAMLDDVEYASNLTKAFDVLRAKNHNLDDCHVDRWLAIKNLTDRANNLNLDPKRNECNYIKLHQRSEPKALRHTDSV